MLPSLELRLVWQRSMDSMQSATQHSRRQVAVSRSGALKEVQREFEILEELATISAGCSGEDTGQCFFLPSV